MYELNTIILNYLYSFFDTKRFISLLGDKL